jgi:hypothetical protein
MTHRQGVLEALFRVRVKQRRVRWGRVRGLANIGRSNG